VFSSLIFESQCNSERRRGSFTRTWSTLSLEIDGVLVVLQTAAVSQLFCGSSDVWQLDGVAPVLLSMGIKVRDQRRSEVNTIDRKREHGGDGFLSNELDLATSFGEIGLSS
jgi:hypothetical protein